MNRLFIIFSTIISLAIYAPQASSVESEFIRSNLPKIYEGTFKWHGKDQTQNIIISVAESFESSGHVIVLGVGEYRTTVRNTKIDIKIQITPNTLRFEMWELNAKEVENFVTDGSYVGTISGDLKTIIAIWTTSTGVNAGAQGDLFLREKTYENVNSTNTSRSRAGRSLSDRKIVDQGQCNGEAMHAYPEPRDPEDHDSGSTTGSFHGYSSSGESFSGRVSSGKGMDIKDVAYFDSIREYKKAMKKLPRLRQQYIDSCMSSRGH